MTAPVSTSIAKLAASAERAGNTAALATDASSAAAHNARAKRDFALPMTSPDA